MKITIATGPIFPVPAVRGGAVQRLWEGLARDFAKRGHEVTIFAREFPGQAKEEIVDGIRYVRRGGYEQSTSIKRDLVQCLLYALKTARHVPPGDVVVTNDFWMPAVLPWLNPAAGKVVPCLQRFPKKQCGLYGKCAALVAVSQAVADAVKAQSPSVADKIVVVPNAIDEVLLRETKRPRDEEAKSRSEAKTARGGDEGKLKEQGTAEAEPRRVAAATNGPKDQEPKGLRDQGTRAVQILYVGRIHPEKGLLLLANALRLLAARDQKTKRQPSLRGGLQSNQLIKDQEPQFADADGDSTSPAEAGGGQTKGLQDYGTRGQTDEQTAWECVLVGPVRESEGGGGEAFAEELKRQVEGLPVRFEAPVYDPAALAKIYDQADVFVYPSAAETGESFGIAPLEAMARGLVPVLSGLAAFREYLQPGVNGMVFDHRTKEAAVELAKALNVLIADSQARERLGEAARTTAQRFSISAIADKYLQLFARMV